MMDTGSKRRSGCPISCALDLLGDRWSLLIIRDMVFVGKRHFKEFLTSPEGIASNILSDRLRKLERQGVVDKQPDPASGRQVVYRLTGKGRALIPILVDLAWWGRRHDAGIEPFEGMFAQIERDRDGYIDGLVRACREGFRGQPPAP